jgi:hypothetical protein
MILQNFKLDEGSEISIEAIKRKRYTNTSLNKVGSILIK